MIQYLNLINRVIQQGIYDDDTRGTATIQSFDEKISVDLSEGFPLVNRQRHYFLGSVGK